MSNQVRTCVGCRARSAPDELLRFVLVGGTLVPDQHRRMPGRGAWIHPARDCLAAAERRRSWTRALRAAGPVDTTGLDLYVEGIPRPLA